MANFKDKISFGNPAILNPQLAYLWKIIWEHPNDDVSITLSKQILSADFNYIEKTVEMVIEQPLIGGALHDVLWDNGSNTHNVSFRIDALDGSENITYSLKVTGKILSHKFKLDYADFSCAKHVLQIGITTLNKID